LSLIELLSGIHIKLCYGKFLINLNKSGMLFGNQQLNQSGRNYCYSADMSRFNCLMILNRKPNILYGILIVDY